MKPSTAPSNDSSKMFPPNAAASGQPPTPPPAPRCAASVRGCRTIKTASPYTIGIPRAPLHHLLRSAVRRFPLNVAIKFEGNWITYRRLNQESNRFANALRSLGVEKGDRVAILMPNIPQFIICFYGVLKAGAVAVFTPPARKPRRSFANSTTRARRCWRPSPNSVISPSKQKSKQKFNTSSSPTSAIIYCRTIRSCLS